MSRHRAVRGLDIEDEYSIDYSSYGRSVDEGDFAVSPSVAQFMFHRDDSSATPLGAFMGSSKVKSPDQIEASPPLSEPPPDLSKLSLDEEAQLYSALEHIRGIIGDSRDQDAIRLLLRHHFDVERVLDIILSGEGASPVLLRSQPVVTVAQPSGPNESSSSGASSSVAYMPASGNSTPVRVPTPSHPRSSSASPRGSPPGQRRNGAASREGSPPPSRAKPRQNFDIVKECAERQDGKELLNLVVLGHVDAGKSTLMGRLLFERGDVGKKLMHKYESESKKAGKGSFAYAWVLDETGEERSRGITMDVGVTHFVTDHKIVTLLDAPGHKDFIPNTITGAAQADVALLVVDASPGAFEAGFHAGGQTREHSLLARSLGVQQVAVIINKLDTVSWSEERFKTISGKMHAFLKQAGFKGSDITFIPCSGLYGENLTKPSQDKALTAWYKGLSVLQQIDSFKIASRPLLKPLRMFVSDVYKGMGSGFCVSGKIESGYVQTSGRLSIMPGSHAATCKGVALHDQAAQWACAGDYATLTITGVDMMHVNVGSVICTSTLEIPSTTKFRARIIVFNVDIPITRGFQVLLHYQTVSEPAIVSKLVSLLSKSGDVLKKRPRCLMKNSTAVVEIETKRLICIEVYKDYKELGRFMLRYAGSTIAAGVVTDILSS